MSNVNSLGLPSGGSRRRSNTVTSMLPGVSSRNSMISEGDDEFDIEKDNPMDKLDIKLGTGSNRRRIVINDPDKKLTFEETINNDKMYDMVRNFSLEEHTEENLDFIMSVRQFEKRKDRKKCRTIIQTFIVVGSEKEINIDYEVRDKILKESKRYEDPVVKAKELDFKIFDPAYEHIADLIKSETLDRFNKSGFHNTKSNINVRQFRHIMIAVNFLNILFFIILVTLSIITSQRLINSYESDTREIALGKDVQIYDRELTYYGRISTYVTDWRRFEKEYNDTAPLLDQALQDLAIADNNYVLAPEVIVANNKLIEMEANGFELLEQNQSIQAQAIYMGSNYTTNKAILNEGIDALMKSIEDEVEASSEHHYVMIIVIITLSAVFFLYTIPATLYIIIQEKRHTSLMLELARSLDRRLKLEISTNKTYTTNNETQLSMVHDRENENIFGVQSNGDITIEVEDVCEISEGEGCYDISSTTLTQHTTSDIYNIPKPNS